MDHARLSYIAVLPVQQVGVMWTELAADEVHLFPTSVDETALRDMPHTIHQLTANSNADSNPDRRSQISRHQIEAIQVT